jgi:starvation-inducible DNA-binding protein
MTTINHEVQEVSDAEFVASPTLKADLQAVLVDLLELQNQAKQAHWNLVGPHFRSIHLEFDEIVDMVREDADSVAERMRALWAVPDGRTRTVVETTTLPPFPEGEISVGRAIAVIAQQSLRTVNVIRAVHDDVDEQDPTSADLLHAVIEGLEKQRWMLNAQLRHILD